ncbi:MAG: hypothetical protein NUW22_13940 [Acidobacteria bacterium]|nr:hypothetical protein [Acidobacteriota bacterium]
MLDAPTDTKQIFQRLRSKRIEYARVQTRMRIRRALISRVLDTNVADNGTGTNVGPPFDSSTMIIRSMLGEPSKAVQHYENRLSANVPNISVVPITTKPKLTQTLDRVAGEQERLDAELWREACAVAGGRGEHQRLASAMVVGGAAYLLTLPRDLAFGLPDRIYHGDMTDEEVALLTREGKLSPSRLPHPKTGELVYAESGDAWASRRKEAMKAGKVAGKGLFMLRALPRDMVLCEKDAAGLRWGAVTEVVPQSVFGAGSQWARFAARHDKTFTGNEAEYSLMLNTKGQVIGGIPQGGPVGYSSRATSSFTFITYTDREDLVYLVAGPNDVEGGREIWRGKHGCTEQGQPACPLDEVACIRGDVDLPDHEFLTPLDPLFAVIPNTNQFLTMRSNIAAWNATPRFVVEVTDGSQLRGNDGEPVNVKSAPTPGMDPTQIAAYPGTVKHLTIDAADLDQSIVTMFGRIDLYMPSPVTQGAAGASAPAWQVHQLIQQAQENLRQPADNLAMAIQRSLLKMHGWLRQLDVPVYFWSVPGHRKDARELRGLIEFDPADLTDSITVKLELDTPEDLIVLDQVGQAKLKDGLITREGYFEEYARVQDARQATVESYGQTVADSLLFGRPLPGSALLAMVAQRVMGRLAVELPGWSPNAARAQAQDMSMAAQQQVAEQEQEGLMGGPPPSEPIVAGAEDVSLANAAGVRQPGVGMAQSLPAQLGMSPV